MQLLNFGSTVLVYYYSIHLPTVLILPNSLPSDLFPLGHVHLIIQSCVLLFVLQCSLSPKISDFSYKVLHCIITQLFSSSVCLPLPVTCYGSKYSISFWCCFNLFLPLFQNRSSNKPLRDICLSIVSK